MTDLAKSDVFLDVCTQRDYLSAGGSRCCMNATELLPRLKSLMAFARWGKVPTISCVDVRRFDEVRGISNPTCVIGTPGQQKLGFSILPRHLACDSDNSLSVSLELLTHYQQVVFSKRHRDPLTNPKLDRLITEMPAGRFVVFGVGLEQPIRLLVLGLLLRNRQVALVPDACGFWNANDADMSLRQITAKGCELITADALIRRALEHRKVEVRHRSGWRRSVA